LPLDLIATYASTVTSANKSNVFSFDLRHQLNNRLELFENLAFFDVANIATTPHSFIMTNPRYKSHTLGVELTTTSGTRFSLGVSDPSSLIEGKVTLMSATGRDAGDTIQYDEKRYQRSHSLNSFKNMSFFMSASIPLEQTRTRSLSLAATLQSGFDLKKAPPQIGLNTSYAF
jgi:hypothetical protein